MVTAGDSDPQTNQIEMASTNVSREQIQVGNWLDVAPETTYEPGKSLLAVGDSETTTLVLQNTRGDGISATGYWALNFERSMIRVYDGNGKEILPWSPWTGGATFLETVPYEKQITVTVVGVSAGEADLKAYWNTWACDIGQSGQREYSPWHWTTNQIVAFNVVGIDIDTDSNLDGKIEHRTDDPIEEALPGRPIRVNWDDDNDNNVVDSQESPVPNENNLAEAIVTLNATDEAFNHMTNWTISLGVVGTTGVKFWDLPTKEHQVVGNWNLSDPAVRSMPWRTGVHIWIEVTDETHLPKSFFVNAVVSQAAGMMASDSIACQEVGTWTRDNWTKTNAHAIAASKLDTLEQLAWYITGAGGCAGSEAYGSNSSGHDNQRRALAQILESRLRNNVVLATNAGKDAKFGRETENPPNYLPANMKEEQVNSIFNGSAPKDPDTGQPAVKYPCDDMAKIEMARGVILTLLPHEFDKLNLTAQGVYDKYWEHTYGLPLQNLKPGDSTEFFNKDDYRVVHPDGYYDFEAVIYIGDWLYSGWTGGGNVARRMPGGSSR